ncbi:retrotransposon protein [Striga asiatica]|uniref:Retrotransposon protein n=1 Tax=Striga asiatica TaxID=4170 RepID=A0A5A7PWG5_STRAF|nr:retrotransposon protein [Striga asiatica]
MANRRNRNAPVPPVAAPPVVPERDLGQRIAEFRGFHPATFNGQGDPRQVEEWVRNLDLIFEVMGCPAPVKVMCAQLQLTGDAGLWWSAYWAMRPGEKTNLTMERQFLSLEQAGRTVDEYELDFSRLTFFAPNLVDTEAKRTKRFRCHGPHDIC